MSYLSDPAPSCAWTGQQCEDWIARTYTDMRGKMGDAVARQLFTSRSRIETPAGNSQLMPQSRIIPASRMSMAQYEDQRQNILSGLGGLVGQWLSQTNPVVRGYDRAGVQKLGGPCNNRGQAWDSTRDSCVERHAPSPEPTPTALNDQLASLLVVLDGVPAGDRVALDSVPSSPEMSVFAAVDRPIADWYYSVRCCLPDFQTVVEFDLPE